MKNTAAELFNQREPRQIGPKGLGISGKDMTTHSSHLRTNLFALSLVIALLISAGTSPAANIWLTGHDVLLHSGQLGYDVSALNYLRTNCKSSPISATNYTIAVLGSGVGSWNFSGPGGAHGTPPGYTTANITYFVMPLPAATWADLVAGPLSKNVLMINSETSCGGCDVSAAGVVEINAHSAQIQAAFNSRMDLYVESGANNPNYYNFLPPGFAVTGPPILSSSGFTATPAGAAAGLTPAKLNGFQTHNRFQGFSSLLTVMEITNAAAGPQYISLAACSITFSSCLSITNRSVECIGTNNTYAWSFCITNQSTNAIGWISITDLPPGVTVNQDLIPLNPVLQPGQGQCTNLLLSLTNSAVNLTNVCFTMGAYSTDFFRCCSTTNCLTLAPCCAYVPPGSVGGPSERLVPIPGQPNCYNYTVTVRNVSSSSEGAEYIYFTADPTYGCLTFTPDIVTLPTVLLPNQQVTVTVKVCLSPDLSCGRCFLISLHDACCSTRHCLPSVAGGAGGAVAVGSPADGSLFMTPASIPLAVTLTPGIEFSSVSYVANGEVVASNSVPPFSAIWSNAPAGDYVLRADGTEAGGGGVWNSDPVTIYVRTDQNGTTNAPGAPILWGALVINETISFMMQTAPEVTYQVEYSDSIISPNWQPIGEIIVGDGGVSALSYSRTNAPQRFYRVRVQ